MKKVYVKPVMESEAFVANEYVAGCWKIACEEGTYTYLGGEKIEHEDHGYIIYVSDKDPNCDIYGDHFDKDGFVYYVNPNYKDTYMGDIGGVEGPHPVKIENRTKPGHPNASV